MTAGRKSKPTAIKQIEGNPGGRPLNTSEPVVIGPCPMPPEILDGHALEEWERLAPPLYRLGVITAGDIGVLTAYCQAWGLLMDAGKELAILRTIGAPHNGMLVHAGTGGLKRNPLLAIMRDASGDLVRFGSELGLSPSSRVRLGMKGTKPTEDNDPAEEFFPST